MSVRPGDPFAGLDRPDGSCDSLSFSAAASGPFSRSEPSPQQNLSHPRFADGVAGLAVEAAPLLRIILRAASEHDCISGPYLNICQRCV